jgi:predicted DNA-binding transcriptional regulator AlpA
MKMQLASPVATTERHLRVPGELAEHIRMSKAYVTKIIREGHGPRTVRLPGGKSRVAKLSDVTRWVDSLASAETVRG